MNIAVTQYRHVDEMRPWSDREHLLECVAVTPEAADVMTFTFKPKPIKRGRLIIDKIGA